MEVIYVSLNTKNKSKLPRIWIQPWLKLKETTIEVTSHKSIKWKALGETNPVNPSTVFDISNSKYYLVRKRRKSILISQRLPRTKSQTDEINTLNKFIFSKEI